MPQTSEEVRSAPRCPKVVGAAKKRGISSIVHFTRIGGLVGILDSSAVKARRDLPHDVRLKHVYEANAVDRSRDLPWHGYVNLSVTAINLHMFEFSKRENPGSQWVIIEFSSEILGDPGVVFCTTNNIYPAAHRCAGLRGFEQMFAPRVPGRYGYPHDRSGLEPKLTTDPQAEVLYPSKLSLEHIRRIIAADEDTLDAVADAGAAFPHCPRVDRDPEAFQ